MKISISEKAKKEFVSLIKEEGEFLRISTVPGGCSGMSYNVFIDNNTTEDDMVLFEEEKLKVLAHRSHVLFLNGLEIDYTDDLVRAGFRFANPNASGGCGCGASFSV